MTCNDADDVLLFPVCAHIRAAAVDMFRQYDDNLLAAFINGIAHEACSVAPNHPRSPALLLAAQLCVLGGHLVEALRSDPQLVEKAMGEDRARRGLPKNFTKQQLMDRLDEVANEPPGNCPDCEGMGELRSGALCPRCKGGGECSN